MRALPLSFFHRSRTSDKYETTSLRAFDMVPGFVITARAKDTSTDTAIYVTQTIANTLTTFTTTILLGNTPAPQPPPTASSSPTNSTVIGAALGSVFGFIFLLVLITCYARNTSSNWRSPYWSPSVSDVSLYVNNPNGLPTAHPHKKGPIPETKIKVTEEKVLVFTRSKRNRRHGPVEAEPDHDGDFEEERGYSRRH